MVRILRPTHKHSLKKIMKKLHKFSKFDIQYTNIRKFKVNKVNRRLLMHVTDDCS